MDTHCMFKSSGKQQQILFYCILNLHIFIVVVQTIHLSSVSFIIQTDSFI
jgi:hypothetical protein